MKEISAHDIEVFEYFKAMHMEGVWKSNQEASSDLQMPSRTVRQKTLRFADHGILEVLETYPGYRYRFNPKALKTSDYARRLQAASIAMGRAA